ncbi:BlaI/MecI/CopY family transcriptional regulator [Stenotrophomonas acidaminiphila]|uniref:BlaI/MecI/CopY family transcriptional regulator n=1 Tax=Stenotrophomonas acidaminiphila TaxID=128780 RepID=UPI00192A4B84|nr:BlaI/MecI/CopY family transcriptional regulator [Stenotrophomonas acidaminiphila]
MIRISEAEAVVMEALWESHPLSAEDVVARLGGRNGWAEATVKTLLNRLLNKGAISATKEGRRYLYAPQVAREAWLLEESSSLLERLFDGRVAPLVAHFSQHRKLSRDDVAELRRLLEELDDDRS